MTARQLKTVSAVRNLFKTGMARQLRLDAHLSGIEVARAAGIAVPTLWRYENGQRLPNIQYALALAKVYKRLGWIEP